MQAFIDALQATKDAETWYSHLCELIRQKVLLPHTPYHELQIISIFDAKPVAFRAKPVRQYQINTPIPDFNTTHIPVNKPKIVGYHEAVEQEKQAWSIFNAQYNQAIMEWLKHPDDRFTQITADILIRVNRFRVWEVKKC